MSDEILDTMITKNSTEREGNIATIMFVLIIIILNKFILGIPLYIHHIIGMIIVCISLITIALIESNTQWSMRSQLFLSLETFSLAMQVVIEKYLLDKKICKWISNSKV